jgi:hypothetical protein
MESVHDSVVRTTPRFTLVANRGDTWAAVEGIRLRDGEAVAAADEVQAFLDETGTQIASWWLTEHTTPADAEAQLLAAGLVRLDDDYLIDRMLTTNEPPPAPADVLARAVAGVDEHIEARHVQYESFGTPAAQRRSDEALAAEHRRTGGVLYGAWIDGRMVGAAGAAFASRGALLVGGATLPWARGRGAYRALVRARWDDAVARGTPALTVGAGPMSAPILGRLGFEKVLQFRRLESRRT